MPTYYDSRNKSYSLTEQIGRGGEGAVFSCDYEAAEEYLRFALCFRAEKFESQ